MTKNDAVERALHYFQKDGFTADGAKHFKVIIEALRQTPQEMGGDRQAALDALDRVQRIKGPPYLMAYDFIHGTDLDKKTGKHNNPGYAYVIRAALQFGDKGREDDRAQLIKIIEAQKDYLKAYKDGKYAMYSMSEEIRDAAIKHLPCGEGPLDRAVSAALRVPPTSEGA